MERKYDRIYSLYAILLVLVRTLAFLAPDAFGQVGPAANYRNVSVQTQLNITNSFPEILAITTGAPITLNAGANTTVFCNMTIRDLDGFQQVQLVNATFFDTAATTLVSADDGNDHYTNSSCSLINNNSDTGNFTCQFQVRYFANAATTWNCTVYAQEIVGNQTSNRSNISEVSQLLALNVTGIIDYGNMVVGQISTNSTEANVTNFGNVEINVSVRGYGAVENDGLAMICDNNNITISNERFSLNSSLPWSSMTAVANTNQTITNLTIPQRTNDTFGGDTFNSTYWKMNVPVVENPGGQCNGTLIFQAEASL